MTQEIILEKLRQNLGPLNSQAVSAVKEVLKMLEHSEVTEAALTEDEKFIGTNVSIEEYEAWSDDDRLRYQTEPEQENAAWIQKKLRELQAAWLMVIDGNVVAHGGLTEYPFENEFDALCKKFGKFPFAFLNPKVLMIEEACRWHETSEHGDFYPTVDIDIHGPAAHLELTADFDTGATGVYADLEILLQNRIISRNKRDIRKIASHLGAGFSYLQKPLWLNVIDQSKNSRRVGILVICVENWESSPFIRINPRRTALIGRETFLSLRPIVHLDFDAHQTTIEYLAQS
jgi:hypothetical protein